MTSSKSVLKSNLRPALAAVLTLAAACSSSPRDEAAQAWGELANPSAFDRVDEPVFFSFRSLGLYEHSSQPVAVRAGNAILPSQVIDSNGDGAPDGVLALVDLKAGATVDIRVVTDAAAVKEAAAGPKRTQAELSRKTGGEWQGRKYVGGSFENVQQLTPPPEHTDHSEFIRYEGPGSNPTRSDTASISTGATASTSSARRPVTWCCSRWDRMASSPIITWPIGAWTF
jgi:unsaturated rhamnogalacturonyl hydrolase